MLSGDRFMAHSLLSAPMNLGLLDPLDCAYAAEDAYRSGQAPLASVEGYIRQLIGWRDYIWHVYWHFGRGYRRRNALQAHARLPKWFADLDADAVDAHCLKDVLAQVRDHGWVHHIPRLMVLSNYALQRGWNPAAVTDWFHRCFVDGYEWVMVANVVGMSQHADGGLMATKPYTSGGAYINRMSDYCGQCRYRPTERVGDRACPFTGGYWWFLDRNAKHLAEQSADEPAAGRTTTAQRSRRCRRTAATSRRPRTLMLAVDKLIAAPPTAAWDVLVDLDAWPKWGPTVSGARLDPPHTELALQRHRDRADVTGVRRPVRDHRVRAGPALGVEGGRHPGNPPPGRAGRRPRTGEHRRAVVGRAYLAVCSIALRRIDAMLTRSAVIRITNRQTPEFP